MVLERFWNGIWFCFKIKSTSYRKYGFAFTYLYLIFASVWFKHFRSLPIRTALGQWELRMCASSSEIIVRPRTLKSELPSFPCCSSFLFLFHAYVSKFSESNQFISDEFLHKIHGVFCALGGLQSLTQYVGNTKVPLNYVGNTKLLDVALSIIIRSSWILVNLCNSLWPRFI